MHTKKERKKDTFLKSKPLLTKLCKTGHNKRENKSKIKDFSNFWLRQVQCIVDRLLKKALI